MKITWNKKMFLILFALIFLIGYVNSLAIILLDLNVFQMVITTTICIIIGVAIIWILDRRGLLADKKKNDGDNSLI